MTSRRIPCPNPQIHTSEEGAGVARCCSPGLHPQIEAAEEGAEMSCRRDGNSPAAPSSLPDDEDMLREILLRLPPLPSSLPRAAAVCKRWLGLVTDPKFHRQFYAHHRKPPLLGAFVCSDEEIVFTPVLDPPNRIPPVRFSLGRCRSSEDYDLLDCRHGLVLVQDIKRKEVVVCDPITGEQRCVAVPSELRRGILKGAVLCAAGDHGQLHGSCHLSSYKVVLVSTCRSDIQYLACVHSLETGLWGNLISTGAPYELFYDDDVPATLVGNCLYWSRGARILEFDLDKQNLAVIMGPPCTTGILYENRQIIQATDGAVGYAILSYPRFEMWQRNINGHGVATWVPWKTIEMHNILKLPQTEGVMGFLLAYDDDTDVLFLLASGNIYMVQIKSMQSRKLYETIDTCRYHPFKSFYMPGTAIRGCYEADMLHDA